MSRSKKKHGIFKDTNKYVKRCLNKMVRRYNKSSIPDGKWYKKICGEWFDCYGWYSWYLKKEMKNNKDCDYINYAKWKYFIK